MAGEEWLGKIRNKIGVIKKADLISQAQKNFLSMPVVHKGTLYWIYAIHPFRLLKWTGRYVEETPILFLPDLYLGLWLERVTGRTDQRGLEHVDAFDDHDVGACRGSHRRAAPRARALTRR